MYRGCIKNPASARFCSGGFETSSCSRVAFAPAKYSLCLMVLACAMPLAAGDDDAAAIASNEAAAAASCKAFAEAEEIFRRTDWGGAGCLRYAQVLHGGKSKKIEAALADQAALPKPAAEEERNIEALIKKLGADEFAAREKASSELAELGPKALPQLQSAVKAEGDAEIVQRCKKISHAIAEKMIPEAALNPMDGLYSLANGDELGLIDKALAEAECPAGENPEKIRAKAGYLYRVLAKQGGAATGGKRNYIINKNMVLGYALLAFPKEYGKTGKNCFIINNNGTLYQRDFGDKAKTEEFVKDCAEFNPTKDWTPGF